MPCKSVVMLGRYEITEVQGKPPAPVVIEIGSVVSKTKYADGHDVCYMRSLCAKIVSSQTTGL